MNIGQIEILDVLQEHEVMTALEIQETLNLNITAIRNCLQRMSKHNLVERIILTKKEVSAKGIRFSGRHYAWRIIENEQKTKSN